MSTPRFDHIAIGLARIADAVPVLVDHLGGVAHSGGPSRFYTWQAWRYQGGGKLEVLEPRGEDGFLHRFLAQPGPGVHHVTFVVPDLDAACARARAHGYEIVGRDDSDPEWMEAFLHPRQALGIVVQMAACRVPAGNDPGSRPAPDLIPGAFPPVRVLGLRMRARSRQRADAQWVGVLQGVASEGTAGSVVYRWPGSAMRIVAELDPVGDEGPVAIEVHGPRTAALPAGLHPVLGTALVPRSDCGA